MENYPSNSFAEKEAKENARAKKVDKPIVSGKVKKKNALQKASDSIFSEDVSNVKTYILRDVLLPAFKKLIDDVVSDGIHMILYGDSGRGNRPSQGSRVSYGSYYNSNRRDYTPDPRSRNGLDYDTVTFNSRSDAEAVLNAMDDIIAQYQMVSVADFYDLCDISTNNYTLNSYVWTEPDIRRAVVVRGYDGWQIKLPKPSPAN